MRIGSLAAAPAEALAVVSGALLALSFPKFGHGAVAWVALAPLLVALAGARGGFAGFRLGYLTGAVSSLGLVYWTALVVVQYGGLALPMGIAVMVVLCLALALFPAVFGWALARWTRAFGPSALLLAPAGWVGMEMLRGHTLLGFSWCLLGYSQQAHPEIIQLARYTAVYGVSFLVASSSAALAYLGAEPRGARRATVAVGTAALLAGAWAHGAWLVRRPVPVAGSLKVGLVQASVRQEDKWDPDQAWQNVERHIELTRRAAAEGARLVVWPESAVPFYFDQNPEVADRLRGLAREQGIYLLFGNDDREEGPGLQDRMWVGAKMLDPAGELVLRYHKMRLVPFGEYVPVQSVFTLGGRLSAKLVGQVADFSPGDEHVVGAADGHLLGVTICYEAIFPELVRGFAARGADLLANVTNDAWYGRSSAPYQHLAMAAFRAVENGKYLVRAANTGFSAVVDPRGRLVARTELFEPTVLVRDVPLAAGSTFYARRGDLFGWSCLAAAAAATAATLRPLRARQTRS